MTIKLADLSKYDIIAKIDCLEFARNNLIVKTIDCKLNTDIPDSTLDRILNNSWGRKRKFIWVNAKLGVVRDKHYNYFVIAKLKKPKKSIALDTNHQLSLF
jgi:hypothetical protein